MFLSRVLPTAHRRTFVSTVLLSRTWESETVVELRKEAKARGLSTKGNKSTLVARIQEHEEHNLSSTSSIRTPGTIRSASTNIVPPLSHKKTSQAASPGIPLADQPDSAKPDFLSIKLPDLSQPPPNAPVQVPYVPDFWNSARPKADPPLEPELPKVHVVSGSVTHYDGGPTYNLEKPQESGSLSTTVQADDPPATSKEVGFWAEFWESLGLPRSFSVRRTLSEAGNLAAQAGEDKSQTRSSPLTDEERKGLYILLGIVGGSWLVGGYLNRPTVVAEEYDAQNQH
ncbi:hypothetical protein OG21DRAFT_490356 [Imleria badia]|nr:hypothetical protein OG21DRAFT_490356 [Imleria badia]